MKESRGIMKKTVSRKLSLKSHGDCGYVAVSEPINNWVPAVIAFLVPMVIYFIFRINLAPLFNFDARTVVGSSNVALTSVFSGSPYAYRPLSVFLETKIGYLYKLFGSKYHAEVVAVVSLLNGLLSFLIYKICANYSRNKFAGLLASFLYMFSVAAIAATWHNLFSAFMLGPLLTTCGAIFSYQQFRSTTNGWRWFWLAVFIISCLIAPWFREMGYIPAATVLIVELSRSFRKFSLFFLIPGVLSLHALLPKALPAMFGLYNGPVKFMFSEGNIGTNIFSPSLNSVTESGLWGLLSTLICRNRAGFIINELPPLLWLCIIPFIAYTTVVSLLDFLRRRSCRKNKYQSPPATRGEGPKLVSWPLRIVCWFSGSIVLILFLFLLHSMLAINIVDSAIVRFLPFIFLMLFMFFAALRFGSLFSVWFMVTIPSLMLLGSNEEIHTAFAIPPLAIICSLYFVELIRCLSNLRKSVLREIFTISTGLVFTLALLDHSSNIAMSFLAVQSINTSHQRISCWLKDNTQGRAVIFTDFGAAADIFYLLKPADQGYKFEPTSYEIIGGSPDTPQLDIIHRAIADGRKVYYIHLKTYSRDQYLPLPIDALKKCITFEVDNFGFMLDPLRFLVDKHRFPRRFVPSEWDNSYGWVGFGKNRFIWRSEIEIYELVGSNAGKLDISSFKNPNRWSLPPKEAGDEAVVD